MMHHQKLVAALKVNGKVLRESGEAVQLPFGSEFSILLKNLNSVRAVVSVSIDGKDVLNGDQLVINANSSMDLERFLNGDQKEGRRFKFIERTSEIEDHRGVGSDDGLIRIEFQYEQQYKWVQPEPYYYTKSWNGGSGGSLGASPSYGDIQCSSSLGADVSKSALRSVGASSSSYATNSVTTQAANFADVNDAGITVQGSKSNQQFHTVHVGALESTKHVIVLQMKGVKGEVPVVAPVTVATRKTCSSCGSTYKSSYEYCAKDGTYLG